MIILQIMSENLVISEKINHYRRKALKAVPKQKRSEFLNLIDDHVEWLTSIIASELLCNEEAISEFYEQIPVWIESAACHEVALNDEFALDLCTHNNPDGEERSYSELCDARDARVRFIWALIAQNIENEPDLRSFHDSKPRVHGKREEIRCFACHKFVFSVECTSDCEITDDYYQPCTHVLRYIDIGNYEHENLDNIDEPDEFIEMLDDMGLISQEKGEIWDTEIVFFKKSAEMLNEIKNCYRRGTRCADWECPECPVEKIKPKN